MTRGSPFQQRLFEDDGLGPAAVPEHLRTLASRLPARARLGTSSWSFSGWSGVVYDRPAPEAVLAREGLAAYARHPLLRTVCLDRTFYAPLAAPALAAYAAQVPDGFRFVVKACSLCTAAHDPGGQPNPSFLDPVWASEQVVQPFREGLRGRAGALVFQFPPLGRSWRREPARFAERLHAFLTALPTQGLLVAVEVRERALLCRPYAEALAASGARPCLSLHPSLPPLAEQRGLAGGGLDGPLVVRWMLRGGRTYEDARARYAPFDRLVEEDPVARESLADLAAAHLARGHDVYVTVNNKAEGSAPLSVFRLAERLAARLAPR